MTCRLGICALVGLLACSALFVGCESTTRARRAEYVLQWSPACSLVDSEPTTAIQKALYTPSQAPGHPPGFPEGLIPRSHIEQVVLAARGGLQRCYDEALPGWSRAKGKVATRFAIGPDGLVLGVRIVSNNTGVHELGCCLASVLTTLRFQTNEGVVYVDWSFVFAVD